MPDCTDTWKVGKIRYYKQTVLSLIFVTEMVSYKNYTGLHQPTYNPGAYLPTTMVESNYYTHLKLASWSSISEDYVNTSSAVVEG